MKESFLTAAFYLSFVFLNVIQGYSNVNTNSNIGKQVKFIYKDLNHQSNYYKLSLCADIEDNPGRTFVKPTKNVHPYSQGSFSQNSDGTI